MVRLRQLSVLFVLMFLVVTIVLFKTITSFSSRQTKDIAKKPKTMLVILTYMRSGSTFASSLIERSPDVFYVFEPLWSISRLMKRGHLAHMHISRSQYRQLTRHTLEFFLTCNMRNLDLFTRSQRFLALSYHTQSFFKCVWNASLTWQDVDCLPFIEGPCRESRVSCVKTIRFKMKDMTYLMDKYPTMKILHLVRDPRATLESQNRYGRFKWKNLSTVAKRFCRRVMLDLKASVSMKAKYPGRIATLRYEDLARRTEVVLEELFMFLGLDFTDDIRDFVYDMTAHVTRHCNSRNCVDLSSEGVSSKWRRLLSYERVSVIDKKCDSLYTDLGYLPVKDEASLRDLSVPVVETKLEM